MRAKLLAAGFFTTLLMIGPTLYANEAPQQPTSKDQPATLKGCLSTEPETDAGDSVVIVIMTDDGKKIIVRGPKALLTKHISHRVKIFGSMTVEQGRETLHVKNLVYISSSCEG